MSNIIETLAISERVRVPATLRRADAKMVIAALYGTPATSFSAVSKDAARDSFVAQCAALALAQAIYGESSRLERLERYAATLPQYKKTKSGEISGTIGQLIAGYRQAVEFGKIMQAQISASDDEIDLSLLASSPSFNALIAPPPPPPKAKATTPATPATAPATTPGTVKANFSKAAEVSSLLHECALDCDGYDNPHLASALTTAETKAAAAAAQAAAAAAAAAEAAEYRAAQAAKFAGDEQAAAAAIIRNIILRKDAESILRGLAQELGFSLRKSARKAA